MATPVNFPAVYVKQGFPDRIAWNLSEANTAEFDGYVWASNVEVIIKSKTLDQRVTDLENGVGSNLAYTLEKDAQGNVVMVEKASGTRTILPKESLTTAQVKQTVAANIVAGPNVSVEKADDGQVTISVPTMTGGAADVQTAVASALQSGSQETLAITTGTSNKVIITNLATKNRPDAELLDLSKHQGKIPVAQVDGLAEALAAVQSGGNTGSASAYSTFGPTTIGDGVSATIRIVHNLGGEVVGVRVWDARTLVAYTPSIAVPAGQEGNALDLTFNTPPAKGSLRVLVEALGPVYIPPTPNPDTTTPPVGEVAGSYLTTAERTPAANNTEWSATSAGSSLSVTSSGWTLRGAVPDSGSAGAAATGKFYTSGRYIIGPDGKTFVPKGFNVGGYVANNISPNENSFVVPMRNDVLKYWKDNGANTLRLAFNGTSIKSWGWLGSSPPYWNGVTGHQGMLNWVAEVVTKWRSYGFVVMLELHDFTDGGQNETHYQQAEQAWSKLAAAYKNDSYVWFNTANEPAVTGAAWTEFQRRMTKAIRDTGATNIVIFDCPIGGTDGDSQKARTLAGPVKQQYPNNLVLSMHHYGWSMDGSDYRDETQYRAWAQANFNAGFPLIHGEVGHRTLTSDSAYSANLQGCTRALTTGRELGIGSLWWAANFGDLFKIHNDNTDFLPENASKPMSAGGAQYINYMKNGGDGSGQVIQGSAPVTTTTPVLPKMELTNKSRYVKIPTDGTADAVSFSVVATSNSATVGIDWFKDGQLLGTSPGALGANAVSAVRPSAANQARPHITSTQAASPLVISKIEDFVVSKVVTTTPTQPTTPVVTTPTPGSSLVAGGTLFGPAYRQVFGKSEYVRAIPNNPPLRTPNDQFLAGRTIQAQADQYFSGINSHKWNLPSYVVDSRDAAKYPKYYVKHRNQRGFGSIDPWGKNVQDAISSVPIPSFAIPSSPNWKPSDGATNDVDSAMSIYDIATDTMWDFWKMYRDPAGQGGQWGTWSCEWAGVTVGVSQKPGVHDVGSTVASGLWGVPMCVGIEELRRGSIEHAIGLELPFYENVWSGNWQPQVSWPAKHSDGTGGSQYPTGLAGQRLQLDPSLSVDTLGLSPLGKMIAKAGQKYGFIITDRSGSVMVRGENPASFIAQGKPDPWYAEGWLVSGQEWKVFQGFPWSKLRALPVDWGKSLGAP